MNAEGNEYPVLVANDNETVWEYPNVPLSQNNSADSHIPSGMKFPTGGLWKLKVYFDEELFAEVTVDVEEG